MADPFPGPLKLPHDDPRLIEDRKTIRPKFNKSHPMAYLLEEVVQHAIAPIVGQTYGSAFMCRNEDQKTVAIHALLHELYENRIISNFDELEFCITRHKHEPLNERKIEDTFSVSVTPNISPSSPDMKQRLANMRVYLDKPRAVPNHAPARRRPEEPHNRMELALT